MTSLQITVTLVQLARTIVLTTATRASCATYPTREQQFTVVVVA